MTHTTKHTPAQRFESRCKELGVTFTQYGITCPKHGQAPAVYDPAINGYECRPCMYQHIMRKDGKYYRATEDEWIAEKAQLEDGTDVSAGEY